MSQDIRITTAGAGSGKTTRLTEMIRDSVTGGECRPTGIIATTFTKAAAEELAERTRRALFAAGEIEAAGRIEESLIGTVHSICARLLERFAFEARISPRVQVIEEQEAEALLGEAVEGACDPAEVLGMERLARRLGQYDARNERPFWKRHVRAIVSKARENRIAPGALPEMAERSVAGLLGSLPAETGEDLDGALAARIAAAIGAIREGGDATKITREALVALSDAVRDLREGHMPWGAWWRLAKLKTAKASQGLVQPVADIAGRVEEHPGLRADLAGYVRAVFSMAARAADQFRAMKEERGALDFVDLEGRTLELLARPDVARVIAEEFDLLFVDEFQDTSPLQLALFLRLASLVRVRTAWVGDIKQAIYGFRGSDPELMGAAVELVRVRGGATEPLGTSYRARRELNDFFNAIFAPAFRETHGFPPEEVRLVAARGAKPELSLALEAWTLSSGVSNKDGSPKSITNAQAASAIAEGVALLMSAGLMVEDRVTKAVRPLRQGDIAILCRLNDRAEEVASALVGRGFSVTRETSGLLGTPEAVFALACLRRLVDPTDTVASAEIVALEGARSPEEWIAHRIGWVSRASGAAGAWGAEGTLASPALVAVERLRSRALLLTPAEALDEALAAADAFGVATTWGPSRGRAAGRRANLEALRGLARAYEDAGRATDQPPTTAGFILWCQRLAAEGMDHLAIDGRADAIQVMTWHGAKGLEWPLVICNNLEEEPRPRIWDEPVVIQGGALDASDPLANRRLQFWPWPFGQQQNNIPLGDRADAGEFGRWAAKAARREELRLLYVGLTRARDILIFATREGKAPASLLGVPALRLPEPPAAGEDVAEAGGVTWRRRRIAAPEAMPAFEPEKSFPWFAPPVARTDKPAAHLTPSAATALAGAAIGRTVRLGGRMPLAALRDDQEAAFGDALHALLAFAMLHPDDGRIEDIARRIFARHGVDSVAYPGEAAAMAARFREGVAATFGPSVVAVEEPFQSMHPGGGIVSGTIDLLLHTAGGLVIIDHKAFPGNEADQAIRALAHSGQLALYREALAGTGQGVASAWIHFAVGGQLIEVRPPEGRADNTSKT